MAAVSGGDVMPTLKIRMIAHRAFLIREISQTKAAQTLFTNSADIARDLLNCRLVIN